jgi:outer membrane protease
MKYFLTIFAAALIASNAFCEDSHKPALAFSAGMGVMRGHTTYQIGGNFETPDGNGRRRFPISELEFPLDVPYGSLGAQLGVADRLEIAGVFKKNISEKAGSMKDRDWGIFSDKYDWWPDPDSLDAFSVSDTKLDALVAEISARLYADPWPFKNAEVTFFVGGKYIYQKFDFTASDLDQWSPSLNEYYGFDAGHIRIPGKVLTYEVTKKMPVATVGFKITAGRNITLDLSLGYSGKVKVRDEDHHLLRSLVSKAKCDGDAFLFSLTGEIELFPRCSFNLKYDYTTIDTHGLEIQYHEYLGQPLEASLEQKNFSDVHMYELAMVYRF